jgi:hypothetical protein
MDLKKIIREEIEISDGVNDDFDWAKGDIEYPIDFLIGKKIYFRSNDLAELEDAGYTMEQLNKEDLTLGKIRWSNYWVINKLDGPRSKNVVIELSGRGTTDYPISEVDDYIRLGIWVVEDDNGNILNESDELQ